jgi:dGTPase
MMAIMQWSTLLDNQRFGKPQRDQHDPGRTPFHKDYDRLIFSAAFRRLGYKAQVHSLSSNDHVHNRLTHSLEVSSVGRSLGIRAGQHLQQQADWPDWIQAHDVGAIVQSACLAHDIGNPPFGHFGESAIRHWYNEFSQQGRLSVLTVDQLQDLLGFEGNAQGLRTITQLEYHRFNGGMRLTYATLGSFIKYPWLSTSRHFATRQKFGCLQAEKEVLTQIAGRLGLLQLEDYEWCRHPLVYLMEAADDICYAIIDLEDGVELGILEEREVLELLAPVISNLQLPDRSQLVDTNSSIRRLTLLRGKVIDYLVTAVIDAFIEQEPLLLEGRLAGDLISYCDATTLQIISAAKLLARKQIFTTQAQARMEVGAYAVIEKLLDGFVNAALEASSGDRISFKAEKHLVLMGAHRPPEGIELYHALCHTMDFIGGMTDQYAVTLAGQISGQMGAV